MGLAVGTMLLIAPPSPALQVQAFQFDPAVLGPRIAAGLVIVLLGLLAVWALGRAAGRWEARRLGSRLAGGSVQAERFETLIRRLVLVVAFLLAALLLSEAFGLQAFTAGLSGVLGYLPQVLAALGLIFVGLLLADAAQRWVTGWAATAGLRRPERAGRGAQLAVYAFTGLVVMGQLGLEVEFLTTSVIIVLAAAVAGAAFAFALGARLTISNIIAAHYVAKLYAAGQRVRIGNIEGRIIRITETSVILAGRDGDVAVPAVDFMTSPTTMLGQEA